MPTLTTKDRARLRDLAGKATPGPWRVHAEMYEGMLLAVGADEETVYATDADMALMGAARTALPALLDALTTAEAARDAAERQVQAVRAALADGVPGYHAAGVPLGLVLKASDIRRALEAEAGQ